MQASDVFFESVLDALAEHIAVLDTTGAIQYVNHSWCRFCEANDGPAPVDWTEMNYLTVCDQSAAAGDDFGRLAREGIEALVAGTRHEYSLEYPCHSPDEARWFLARMTLMAVHGVTYIVVSHHDITQRKLAEQRADALARTDGLTGVANRGHFDWFLDQEWRRALRGGDAVSLLLLDIDFFKPFNDVYGHQAGDEALRRVAEALQATLKRASDLVARYGGEEFVIVLGQSNAAEAATNAQRVLDAVRALAIPHGHSEVAAFVTVSIGVVTREPSVGEEPSMLISLADNALYEAKDAGRDRFVVAPDP